MACGAAGSGFTLIMTGTLVFESDSNKLLFKFFAVYFIPDNQFIGTVKISLSNSYNDEFDIADIGIMIGDKSFWGKGLSSIILLSICSYALNELKVRKLTAGAISENVAVIKSFQKINIFLYFQ
jgi:RimJ/RimL family protein N-acetyltransferase